MAIGIGISLARPPRTGEGGPPPPGLVSDLVAFVDGPGDYSVSLNWSASPNTDSYDIYVDFAGSGFSYLASTSTPGYGDAREPSPGSLAYYVVSVGPGGFSEPSAPAYVTVSDPA